MTRAQGATPAACRWSTPCRGCCAGLDAPRSRHVLGWRCPHCPWALCTGTGVAWPRHSARAGATLAVTWPQGGKPRATLPPASHRPVPPRACPAQHHRQDMQPGVTSVPAAGGFRVQGSGFRVKGFGLRTHPSYPRLGGPSSTLGREWEKSHRLRCRQFGAPSPWKRLEQNCSSAAVCAELQGVFRWEG